MTGEELKMQRMVTVIALDVLKQAKIEAVREGRTLAQVVEDAMREYCRQARTEQ